MYTGFKIFHDLRDEFVKAKSIEEFK